MIFGSSPYGSSPYGGSGFARIFTKTLTETVNVSSSLIRSLTRTFSDTINTAIQSIVRALNRTLAESLNVSDLFTATAVTVKTFIENIGLSDHGPSELDDSYATYNGYGATATSPNHIYGQTFESNGGRLQSVTFRINKVGTPAGNLYAKIYATTGTFGVNDKPTGSALATSDAVVANSVSGAGGNVSFPFSGAEKINLVDGTKYAVLLFNDGILGGGNQVNLEGDTGSYTHPGNAVLSTDGGSSWGSFTNRDFVFYVYVSKPILIKDITRPITDNLVVSSVLAKVGTFYKTLTENVTISSSLIKQLSRTITNTVSTTSSIIRSITRTLSDTANMSEVFTRALSKFKTFTETIITASIISATATVSKSLTLIYNILEFILGLRVIPIFLSAKKDQPNLVGARKDNPELVSGKPDKPTIISARKA